MFYRENPSFASTYLEKIAGMQEQTVSSLFQRAGGG
jgi:hypothetical protein